MKYKGSIAHTCIVGTNCPDQLKNALRHYKVAVNHFEFIGDVEQLEFFKEGKDLIEAKLNKENPNPSHQQPVPPDD